MENDQRTYVLKKTEGCCNSPGADRSQNSCSRQEDTKTAKTTEDVSIQSGRRGSAQWSGLCSSHGRCSTFFLLTFMKVLTFSFFPAHVAVLHSCFHSDKLIYNSINQWLHWLPTERKRKLWQTRMKSDISFNTRYFIKCNSIRRISKCPQYDNHL